MATRLPSRRPPRRAAAAVQGSAASAGSAVATRPQPRGAPAEVYRLLASVCTLAKWRRLVPVAPFVATPPPQAWFLVCVLKVTRPWNSGPT